MKKIMNKTCNCFKQVNQMKSFTRNIKDNRPFCFINRQQNKKVNKIFVFRSRIKKLLRPKGRLPLIWSLQTGNKSEGQGHLIRIQMIKIQSSFNGIKLSLRFKKSKEK